MASKAKPYNVEKALAQFMEIATTEVIEIGDKITHSYWAMIIDSDSHTARMFILTVLAFIG